MPHYTQTPHCSKLLQNQTSFALCMQKKWRTSSGNEVSTPCFATSADNATVVKEGYQPTNADKQYLPGEICASQWPRSPRQTWKSCKIHSIDQPSISNIRQRTNSSKKICLDNGNCYGGQHKVPHEIVSMETVINLLPNVPIEDPLAAVSCGPLPQDDRSESGRRLS